MLKNCITIVFYIVFYDSLSIGWDCYSTANTAVTIAALTIVLLPPMVNQGQKKD
jgi:hypothetical protein